MSSARRSGGTADDDTRAMPRLRGPGKDWGGFRIRVGLEGALCRHGYRAELLQPS